MFRFLKSIGRGWRREPTPVLVSVVSIALGITAVTVVFSTVRATLVRPIPGTSATGLIRIQGGGGSDPLLVVSYPEFEAIKAGTALELTAERVNSAGVVVDGEAHSVGVAAVSPGYFELLGVRFVAGGGLAADGEPGVAVSEAFWRARMAADPQVLSRTLAVNGRQYAIRGVVGGGFEGAFPVFRVAAWVPLGEIEQVLPGDGSLSLMGDRFLNVLGRVPDGVGRASLEERLEAVAGSLRPLPSFPNERGFHIASAGGTHPSLKPIAATILAVMSVVSVVVLIVGCANVGGILLAQGESRRSELALHLCMGASRASLVRRLLGESVLLGLAGGLSGLTVSALVLRVLSSVRPPVDVPLGLRLTMDLQTAVFAVALGLLTGLTFGTWPALCASARSPARDLTRGGSDAGGHDRLLFRTLVVFQTLAATFLIAAGGLLVRGLGGLGDLEPGFRREGVLTVEADLPAWSDDQVDAYWNRVRELAVTAPGVEAGAVGLFVHLGGRADQRRVRAGATADWLTPPVNYSIVENGLFELLEIPLTRGRAFDPGLSERDPLEVVVNQELARRLWPAADPVGRTLELDDPDDGPRPALVVGVAKTVKYRRPDEVQTPFFYFSSAQWRRSGMVLHLRTVRGSEDTALAALRSSLRTVDPSVPLTVRRMSEHVRVGEIVARMMRNLLLYTGSAALVIAVSGVFGVVSFLSARRVPELAVRLAVGASPGAVRRMVMLDTLRFVAVGLVGGLVVTAALASRLSGLLFGIAPHDPPTFLSVTAIVLGIGVLAAWLPAQRTARATELIEALRGR